MPRAPKKCGRHGCHERVTARPYCDLHTAEQQKRSGWGRGSTRQSRTTRALVLQHWPTCYLRYPGCTITSTEDDHVKPRAQGGTDDIRNRRGACEHCHGIKSRREAAQGRYGAGSPPPPF